MSKDTDNIIDSSTNWHFIPYPIVYLVSFWPLLTLRLCLCLQRLIRLILAMGSVCCKVHKGSMVEFWLLQPPFSFSLIFLIPLSFSIKMISHCGNRPMSAGHVLMFKVPSFEDQFPSVLSFASADPCIRGDDHRVFLWWKVHHIKFDTASWFYSFLFLYLDGLESIIT